MNIEQTIANGQVIWTLLVIAFLLFMIAIKLYSKDDTTKKKTTNNTNK